MINLSKFSRPGLFATRKCRIHSRILSGSCSAYPISSRFLTPSPLLVQSKSYSSKASDMPEQESDTSNQFFQVQYIDPKRQSLSCRTSSEPIQSRNEIVERWVYTNEDGRNYDIEVVKNILRTHKVFIWQIFGDTQVILPLDTMQQADELYQCLKAIFDLRKADPKDDTGENLFQDGFYGSAHDYNIVLECRKRRDGQFYRRVVINAIHRKTNKSKSISIIPSRLVKFLSIFEDILKKYGSEISSDEITKAAPARLNKKTEFFTSYRSEEFLKKEPEILPKYFLNISPPLSVDLIKDEQNTTLKFRQPDVAHLQIFSLQGVESLIQIMKDVSSKFGSEEKAGHKAGEVLYTNSFTDIEKNRDNNIKVKLESRKFHERFDFYFCMARDVESKTLTLPIRIPRFELGSVRKYLQHEVIPEWKKSQEKLDCSSVDESIKSSPEFLTNQNSYSPENSDVRTSTFNPIRRDTMPGYQIKNEVIETWFFKTISREYEFRLCKHIEKGNWKVYMEERKLKNKTYAIILFETIGRVKEVLTVFEKINSIYIDNQDKVQSTKPGDVIFETSLYGSRGSFITYYIVFRKAFDENQSDFVYFMATNNVDKTNKKKTIMLIDIKSTLPRIISNLKKVLNVVDSFKGAEKELFTNMGKHEVVENPEMTVTLGLVKSQSNNIYMKIKQKNNWSSRYYIKYLESLESTKEFLDAINAVMKKMKEVKSSGMFDEIPEKQEIFAYKFSDIKHDYEVVLKKGRPSSKILPTDFDMFIHQNPKGVKRDPNEKPNVEQMPIKISGDLLEKVRDSVQKLI